MLLIRLFCDLMAIKYDNQPVTHDPKNSGTYLLL